MWHFNTLLLPQVIHPTIYCYIIQQTGNENTKTYQVEVGIMI